MNTLHIVLEETFISLRDLHKLGGLHIQSLYYDPDARKLTGANDKVRFIPKCFKYLFGAFHYLSKRKNLEGKVLIED